MNRLILHIGAFLGICLIVLPANAQIYSSTADAVKAISYKTFVGNDQLFAFFQSNGSEKTGTLSADGPSDSTFTFEWTKYDPESDGFNTVISTETDVASSTIRNLTEGGYRVRVTNNAEIDTSWTAWVMLNNLKVWNLKDAKGNIPSYQSNCAEVNQLSLSGFVEVDSFYYFDPVSHDTIWYDNDYTIEWSSDDPELFIPNKTDKNAMALNTTYLPPIEDTWFILSATDSLGMTEIDSVYFDSPFTEAKFTVEYWDKVIAQESANPEEPWDPDLTTSWSLDEGSLDAPLAVRFINESVNGFKFHWVLLDTTNELTMERTLETVTTNDSSVMPEITYYTANEFYYPYLISYGDTLLSNPPCSDTFEFDGGIEVVESILDIPNVFSPNDDGNNDYFLFKHQSIKSFKITISDRTGKIVYRDQIEDIYEWEGWNGKIHNKGRDVPEGQYFYIVEGIGYDDQIYKTDNWIKRWNNERQQGGGFFSGGTSGQTPQGGDDEEQSSLERYIGYLYLYRNKGEF